jgi:hypothetical protein
MPLMITKIAPITNPVRPPSGPKVRRNAAAPTSANAAATEPRSLDWTAVATATDKQQPSEAPAPQPSRSRNAPRGTASAALRPPKQAVTPMAGSSAAMPIAKGAQVASAPASPARRSMPRRSTRNASVQTLAGTAS